MNFYSVEDVKAMLKISEGTLYRYIKEGKIPAVKFGRRYRISEETLKAFAEGRGGDPITPAATSKTAKAETAEAGDAGTAEAPAETADAEAPKA